MALAAAFALPATAADFPKGSPKFATNYRAAVAEAKKSGKPLIVVFSAAWCPPCQQMKKSVYPSAEVTPMHDKFIWAYLDVDETENAEVVKKLKVETIPHIEFLDKNGKSLGNQLDANSPAAFAKTLQGILKKAGAESPAPAKSGA